MLVNKDFKKRIKQNYSKQLYSFFKKTIIPIAVKEKLSENDLFELLDSLKELENNKKELKEISKLYKQNPKLIINLFLYGFPFSENNLKKYLDIFGEKLLESHLEQILSLDIEHPNLKPILPYLRNNEELLIKLSTNKYPIIFNGKQNINGNIIADNFDKYVNALKNHFLVRLDDSEMKKYLSLDSDTNLKFNKCLDLITSSTIYTTVNYINNNTAQIILLKYLTTNPQHLDRFINEIQNSQNKFCLVDFLKKPENKSITQSFICIMLNNDFDFNQQRDMLFKLFFPKTEHNTRLREMIEQKNNNDHKFPQEINDYLECFQKLENSTNNDDLIEFYEIFKNKDLISTEKVEEYIIIEYNRHLDSLLTKIEDIKNNNNVIVSTEQFTSKQYNKSGEIQIYTLYNVPLIYLGHSIVKSKEDIHQDEYKEKIIFTKELCEKPHLWTANPSHGTNYISMTLQATNKMSVFGRPNIYLGFNHLSEKQIKHSNTGDANTPMKKNTVIQNGVNLVSPEYVISSKSIGYSEFVSERNNVLPNFLVTTTNPTKTGIPPLTDETKEWALYYNIPILNLDSESYFKGNYTIFKNHLEKLHNSSNFPTREDIETLLFLQQTTSLYSQPGEEKYPELMPNNQYPLVFALASTNNREWTQENIENLKHLYNTLRALSNSSIPEHYQQLEHLRLLIEHKEQESSFKI